MGIKVNRFLAAVTSYSEYFSSDNYYEFAEPMKRVDSVGNSIYYIMVMFASFVAVIILMLVAMKMMLGNSKEKASSKSKLISSVCIIFAIFGLAAIINEITGIVAGINFW